MTLTSGIDKPVTHAIQWCSLLAITYVAFILLLPGNHSTMQAYGLNSLEYKVIMLAATLPSIFVWFAAFIGYDALRQYAYAIRKTSEGDQFRQLAFGCTWLAWSLPISMLVSISLNSIGNQWPQFHAAAIIITNYTSLILPLIAFVLIGNAARSLLNSTSYNFSVSYARLITILFALFGIVYCYLSFQHLGIDSLSSTRNPYFLPVWLMVISIIIPYLYSWFVGMLGAYELALFGKNTTGLIYRRALLFVAWGVIAVIISSIALQYVNAVIPRVGHFLLDFRFSMNLLFRILGAAGFILIAVGARRLRKIEEV